ncbi:MAG TPA: type II secretion system protein GspM [Rhodanobacteraceae bacterium]|nr:type II secretion system protein GspM [Rhodanobacteraceae bacterium]
MQLKLPTDGRPLAVGLLLAVLLVGYFLFVHWWFVAPQLDIAHQMTDLREQQQRFAAVVAQKADIQKRLDAVRAYEENNQAFLPEVDPAAASASLIQRVTDVIKKHDPDGKRCSAQQSTPMQRPTGGEPYLKVSVRIRLSCDMEPLAAVLYELEQGKPFLFVDELMLYQQASFYRRGKQSSKLDAQFTVSGYLRQRGGKA